MEARDSEDDALLAEQIAYYRARAPEYDEWFARRGRYDRGSEHTARWEAEVEVVRDALHSSGLRGRVLELACGTGWWTAELARSADSVTAVDSSPEVLQLNQERVGGSAVQYIEADIFDWQPPQTFDAVFFAFWLTHVPPDRFSAFWKLVDSCLGREGRVFFVDNRWYPEYRWPAGEAPLSEKAAAPHLAVRELNDGRRFDMVKVFYEAQELTARLEELGWIGSISETQEFFIWGELERAVDA